MKRMWCLLGCVILVWGFVDAQGPDALPSSPDKCVCSGQYACPGNVTEVQCTNRRTRGRPDCPCCKVCARQLGETCNDSDKPCDHKFGLYCSEQRDCQAKQQCDLDGDCPDDQFCLAGVCANPCQILSPCSDSLKNGVCVVSNHRPVCQCPEGYTQVKLECMPAKCIWEEQEYDIGSHTYDKDCTKKCICQEGGIMECTQEFQCLPGFFKRSQFGHDPTCVQNTDDPFADECCVTVVCGNNGEQKLTDALPNADICDSIVCGANANCTVNSETQKAKCECLEGWTGEPNNTQVGCLETVTEALVDATDLPESPSTSTQADLTTIEADSNLHAEDITHNTTTIHLPTDKGGKLYMVLKSLYSGNETKWKQYTLRVGFGFGSSQARSRLFRVFPNQPISKIIDDHSGPEMCLVYQKESFKRRAPFCCNPERKVPFEVASYKIENLKPNTQYVFKWNTKAPMAPVLTIVTQDGCKTTDNVTYGIGQNFTEGCDQKCECVVGGNIRCKVRCALLAEDPVPDNCTQEVDDADPECCVKHICIKNETEAAPIVDEEFLMGVRPKLIVTERTHNSISVAWDDFKARSYEYGYVVEYRENGTKVWQQQEVVDNLALAVINNLHPSTSYQVKVSIFDDTKKLAISTETVNVTTRDGCFHNNTSHGVGDEFNLGCESVCRCHTNGSVTCTPRHCQTPYFLKGSFSHDELCEEHPTGDVEDECCVLVACAQASDPDQNLHMLDLCAAILCAANAECFVESNSSTPQCRCMEGYTGTPAEGCTPTDEVKSKHACQHGNHTYQPGDQFFDGCEYKCTCSNKTEIECQPRCPYLLNIIEEPGCTKMQDPQDECCQVVMCTSNSTNTTKQEGIPSVSLPFEGCIYKNKTYKKDQKFFDGCKQKCQCMGYGDVSCSPRCPPIQKKEGETCVTLPDPEDACCEVSVCATPPKPIDVMKVSDGCVVDGVSISVGEEFEEGCSQRCLCIAHNVSHCVPRCPSLNLIQGDLDGCTYVPDPNDPCCQIPLCPERISPVTTTVKPVDESDNMKNGRSDNAELVVVLGAKPVNGTTVMLLLQLSPSLRSYLKSDIGELSIRYGPEQAATIKSPEIKFSGEIAEVMLHDLKPSTTYHLQVQILEEKAPPVTVIMPGVKRHVVVSDSSQNGCKINGEMVEAGTEFKKGCEEVCLCVGSDMHHCIPRCPKFELFEGCELVKDPEDECCQIPHCTPQPVTTVPVVSEAPEEVPDILLGCENNGTVVPDGEEYFQGCEYRCMCMGRNMSHCVPRCPALLQPPGCHLIPDPRDNCCTIPSCPEEKPIEIPSSTAAASSTTSPPTSGCSYKGKHYDAGAEFYDDCSSFCICSESSELTCLEIKCPKDNGLRHLRNDCGKWEPDPTFVADPPNCCPKYVCVQDISCVFEGQRFGNYDDIPKHLTGCERSCYCEFGNVTCDKLCPPVPASPPPHCLQQAELAHRPGDDCCYEWRCVNPSSVPLPPDFPGRPPSFPYPSRPTPLFEGTVDSISAEAINSTSVRVSLRIPPIYIGLMDFVDILYTDDVFAEPDPSSWNKVTFVVPRAMQEKQELMFSFGGLEPSTQYSLTASVHFIEVNNTATSPVVRVTTLSPGESPSVDELPIDAGVVVTDVGSSWALLQWRGLDQHEIQLIQRIKISYRNLDQSPKIWKETDVINRQDTRYKMLHLTPSTRYEAKLVFVPRQHFARLVSVRSVEFKTKPIERQPYEDVQINMALSALEINPEWVVIEWRPLSPQEKQFVDGIQLKYRPITTTNNAEWMYSRMIHQDVTSYRLDVKPDTDYEVGISFESDKPIRLVSSQLLLVSTPPLPGFDFKMTISSGTVTSKSVEIQLPAIPSEQFQQINVLKVTASTEQEQDISTWVSPSLQPFTAVLRPLSPNTEYMIEAEVFLGNGKTAKSNIIKVKTADGDEMSVDYNNVDILLSPGKITATSLELSWSGVPDPQSKYVHVYRIVAMRGVSTTEKDQWKIPSPHETTTTLTDLKPGTRYRIWLEAYLANGDRIFSNVLEIKTKTEKSIAELLDKGNATEPVKIPVDAKLHVTNIHPSWVMVQWRKFDAKELKFIDGIQLRYRNPNENSQVWRMTPLIHRETTKYKLEELNQNTEYELGITFLPFPNSNTELISNVSVQIHTTTDKDDYDFNLTLSAGKISATSVELSWSGVPYPQSRYVHVFRILASISHQEKDTIPTWKIPSPHETTTTLTNLKPDTRYRIWLEAYFTNGNTNFTNVLEIRTKTQKSTVAPTLDKENLPLSSESETSSKSQEELSSEEKKTSYFAAFVVAVILAILFAAILLVTVIIFVRKQNKAKATITAKPPQQAYDNPSFKTTESIEMNGKTTEA